MFSAYGLKYSVANKEKYLQNFLKNRILVLLIPFWITNMIRAFLAPSNSILDNILIIIGIKDISFVTILLVYYIVFWLVYKLIKNQKTADFILCIIVLLYSILGKAINLSSGWMVESIGFIYGILIYYQTPILIKIRKIKHFIIFGISSFIFGLLYLKYKTIYMLGTWFLRAILSASLILLLTTILNNYRIKSRTLTYIGNISYEIYLMHGIVMNLILNIKIPSMLWIILCIILIIFASSIVKLVDTPIIKFIKTMNWRKNENSNDRT